MKFSIGIVLMSLVLAFITYQLGYGGGKRENGREGRGLGGMPLW